MRLSILWFNKEFFTFVGLRRVQGSVLWTGAGIISTTTGNDRHSNSLLFIILVFLVLATTHLAADVHTLQQALYQIREGKILIL